MTRKLLGAIQKSLEKINISKLVYIGQSKVWLFTGRSCNENLKSHPPARSEKSPTHLRLYILLCKRNGNEIKVYILPFSIWEICWCDSSGKTSLELRKCNNFSNCSRGKSLGKKPFVIYSIFSWFFHDLFVFFLVYLIFSSDLHPGKINA